jgi:GNAT superfamily N-acetyltransferase
MTHLNRRDFTAIGLSTLFAGRAPGVELHLRSSHRTDIVIRPFTPGDAAAVGGLVDAEYQNDADRASSLYDINRGLHLPSGTGNDRRSTLVAEQDGAVIGVGSSGSLALGMHARTHVIVAPSHRRRGIGTRLYRDIAPRVRAQGRTPVASVAAREGVAFLFASSCGMQPLMRSRQLTLDLTSWPVDLWCRHALDQPSPYPLVPSARVAPDVFFGALGAAYHYMHARWSDVQVETPAQARATWSGRVSDSSGVVAFEGERAVGVGNYFPNGAVDRGVVVFPTGVCGKLPSLDHERALTARLLGDRLLAARTAGNREAILEFDDDDGRLLSVIASIPVSSINESFTLTAGPTSHWPTRP